MLPESLLDYIRTREITYLKMTPSLFGAIVADSHFSLEKFRTLRLVVLGGEAIRVTDVEKAYRLCPHLRIMNHYGPTEVTIGCIAQYVDADPGALEMYKTRPTIGKPIFNTGVFILDKYLNILPVGVAGELCMSGASVARGYLNSPEFTAEKFCVFSPFTFHLSPLYKTGDSARWLSSGNIEFLGRIDHQVKVRGYRIELGEIQGQLLAHKEIKDVFVTHGTNETGGRYLCAYIVPRAPMSTEPPSLQIPALKKYLSSSLPDYMVPSYFTLLEKIPLTPNGKIDRRALPLPEIVSGREYASPRDEVEEKLVEIWAEVLSHTSIGIHDNFFEVGGHSLRAVILLSRIHKELNIKVPLAEIFRNPSISGLAAYIKGAVEDRHAAVEPVEKKEYYSLSSAQKRLYILQQMELTGTAYNMPRTIPLMEELDIEKLEKVFLQLIERHESLRTSFPVTDDHPVQKVHDNIEFKIERLAAAADTIEGFVRAFDLSRAPLLRVGLMKTGEGGYLLLVDTHHIISDGVSRRVLERDFAALYWGGELEPLKIQYKDFSEWQNSETQREVMKQQEAYWLNRFTDKIPVLNLPTDFPRQAVKQFEGSRVRFEIGKAETTVLREIARVEGVTMFMVLIAFYNVLLSKLAGQEDIVIGTVVAGRRHTDLEQIMGMFVNTLVLKNNPQKEKTFMEFLREVKKGALEAFENQDYQLEDLVDKLVVKRDPSRHPLFDVMFALQTRDAPLHEKVEEEPGGETPGISRQQYRYEDRTAKTDLLFNGIDEGERVGFSIEYSTELFKKETIERFAGYYKEIAAAVIKNRGVKLKEIKISVDLFEQQLDNPDIDFGF